MHWVWLTGPRLANRPRSMCPAPTNPHSHTHPHTHAHPPTPTHTQTHIYSLRPPWSKRKKASRIVCSRPQTGRLPQQNTRRRIQFSQRATTSRKHLPLEERSETNRWTLASTSMRRVSNHKKSKKNWQSRSRCKEIKRNRRTSHSNPQSAKPAKELYAAPLGPLQSGQTPPLSHAFRQPSLLLYALNFNLFRACLTVRLWVWSSRNNTGELHNNKLFFASDGVKNWQSQGGRRSDLAGKGTLPEERSTEAAAAVQWPRSLHVPAQHQQNVRFSIYSQFWAPRKQQLVFHECQPLARGSSSAWLVSLSLSLLQPCPGGLSCNRWICASQPLPLFYSLTHLALLSRTCVEALESCKRKTSSKKKNSTFSTSSTWMPKTNKRRRNWKAKASSNKNSLIFYLPSQLAGQHSQTSLHLLTHIFLLVKRIATIQFPSQHLLQVSDRGPLHRTDAAAYPAKTEQGKVTHVLRLCFALTNSGAG